jgi:hypothetical protein
MSPVGAVVAAGAFSSSGVPLAAIIVAIFAKVPAVNGRMNLCVYLLSESADICSISDWGTVIKGKCEYSCRTPLLRSCALRPWRFH